ncbi:hypothetical protein QQ045_009350 [Rhodiola kirilowii]
MAATRMSACAAMAAAAAATISAASPNVAYADFRFNPFSKSSSSDTPPQAPSSSQPETPGEPVQEEKPEPEVAKGSFDADSLERGAKALREMNSSPYKKQLYELMKSQEKTRQSELGVEKLGYEAYQARADIERQLKLFEEENNNMQKQAQYKAQMLRTEDDLARKRLKDDNEAQRKNNVDLVEMQLQSALKKERARIANELKLQEQIRQEEQKRAEIDRVTIQVKAKADAEARVHEAKLTEEHDRRMLVEKLNGEKEKWLAAINTTFSHIEEGVRALLTDRSKLIMTVGGATALAAGIYTTREGSRVTWGYINRILGQPSLIRESSMTRFPWSGVVSKGVKALPFTSASSSRASAEGRSTLGNVILHPSLQKRIEQLARATSNTKLHQAPFRNMLFYGPPGTGKTMVAREIARRSGLDYAMMTGGDVAPLGPQAVTKIHEIFDWAKKSKKGLLLFIDEADAFLCERNSMYMSEAQRSALNALLFRTGDQSKDIVLVLATNRPGDLDSAVTDRIDEVIEFPLPGEEERFKLLKLYLNKYLIEEPESKPGLGLLLKKKPQKITIKDISDDILREAAKKTEGFSGREIAKLMAGVQASVYGRSDCALDPELFMEVVDYKVKEHHQRIKLAEGDIHPAFC